MLNYMREGGFNMWLMLATALGVAIYAVTRAPHKRSGAFHAGAIALLIEGMFGLATGMVAVSSKYTLFPDRVEAIAIGLGELSNNGSFGAILALLLGVAAIVTKARADAPAPAKA